MSKRWWLIPLAALGAALLYVGRRHSRLDRMSTNVRSFDMPSAGVYDTFSTALFSGFYASIARELATACPAGAALDVGCGPGHVAVFLAQAAPNLTVLGVDVAPDMIERASSRARQSGVGERVRFQIGSAEELPFADREFDLVFSTLSLHHWGDPVRGLTEIHRVLKPGGAAHVYDVADWLLRVTHHGTGLEKMLAASPFGDGTMETVRRLGPVPLLRRALLRRVDGAGEEARRWRS